MLVSRGGPCTRSVDARSRAQVSRPTRTPRVERHRSEQLAGNHGKTSIRAYVEEVRLSDVIDLEVQLALDEGRDEEALRTRDRAIFLALEPKPEGAGALLTAWLAGLRARFGEPRLGEQVATAQRVVAYGLAFSGVMLGSGTVELLLGFEQGGAPINVGHYLLVLVFGQLATLALLILSFGLRAVWSRLPLVGDVGRLLRFLTTWLARRLEAREGRSEAVDAQRAAYRRVRTRLGLYGELERYALLGQSQLFALAFNVGALVSCVRLIVFSDLAFAWSTSVAAFDADEVQRMCRLLAAPFGWLAPDAVPSAALIEQTQYYRLDGRFAGAAAGTRGDAQLAAEWWRFLVACTVTYGLLPRVVTALLFRHGLRRAEARVPLDTPAVERVLARLSTPALATRAPFIAPQAAEPGRTVANEPPAPEAASLLIVYRDVPTAPALLSRELGRALGLTVTQVHRAGGFDAPADARLLSQLAAERSSVCVVAEAWEAPDKSLRNLLSALRRALGPRRALRVVLIGEASEEGYAAPAAEDVLVFRNRLTLLEDPYLSIDTLPAASLREPHDEVRE